MAGITPEMAKKLAEEFDKYVGVERNIRARAYEDGAEMGEIIVFGRKRMADGSIERAARRKLLARLSNKEEIVERDF